MEVNDLLFIAVHQKKRSFDAVCWTTEWASSP